MSIKSRLESLFLIIALAAFAGGGCDAVPAGAVGDFIQDLDLDGLDQGALDQDEPDLAQLRRNLRRSDPFRSRGVDPARDASTGFWGRLASSRKLNVKD